MKPISWLRGIYSGLGFRMMTVMGLALLPLALLSYVQGIQTMRLSGDMATNAVLGETFVAAAPLIAEVVKAQGKAATLAATVPTLLSQGAGGSDGNEMADCIAVMRQVVSASIGMVQFAGYIPSSGQMECSSRDEPHNFVHVEAFQRMIAAGRPMITASPYDLLLRVPVLLYSHPVRNPQGDLMGVVVLTMPQFNLERQRPYNSLAKDEPLHLATFDAGGKVLTSSSGMALLPDLMPNAHRLADLAKEGPQAFSDSTSGGGMRAFAVVPIQPGSLYLLGSWSADRLENNIFQGSLPQVLFPALMWAASLLVAALAAESHVLRHIRALRDSLSAFAAGDRRLRRLDMSEAASELQVVANAYERMAEAVVLNEAELENEIYQKEVLLREVHHRVKNNLQLIASILNMQLRSARSREAKEAMRNVQERVMSLATVHRELYQTSGLVDVRADELLTRVASDLLKIAALPGQPVSMRSDIEDIRLPPDQAVPLALFLTEAMANVLKHGATGEQSGGSVVYLGLRRQEDGMVEFVLRNKIRSQDTSETGINWDEGSGGFGSQLLRAFCLQLGGRIDRRVEDGDYILRLVFTLRQASPEEMRRPNVNRVAT